MHGGVGSHIIGLPGIQRCFVPHLDEPAPHPRLFQFAAEYRKLLMLLSHEAYPVERRISKPIAPPLLSTVRDLDADGLPFCADLRPDTLSAAGVCFHLPCRIAVGTPLIFLIHFILDLAAEGAAARVLVCGRVCPVEPQPNGRGGAVIAFTA